MASIEVSNDLEDFSVELYVDDEGHSTISIERYNGNSEKVVVPGSIGGIRVASIGAFTFSNREDIKQVILPENLGFIGEDAFQNCTALADINLPDNVFSIGGFAFKGCTALTGINLPKELNFIEYEAFKDCGQLTSINLPKELEYIYDGAFAGCGKLTEFTIDKDNPFFTVVDGVLFDKAMIGIVSYPAGKKGEYTIPDGVFNVLRQTFDGCNEITRLNIPQSFIGNRGYTFYEYLKSPRLTDITVNEHNPVYSSIDGVLFNKEGTVLLKYPQGRTNKEYTVPDGVIVIGNSAFCDCKYPENIILPESLEFIETDVFNGCEKLAALTLPMNLKYVGGGAFYGCSNLETITLSGNTKISQATLESFSDKLIYRD